MLTNKLLAYANPETGEIYSADIVNLYMEPNFEKMVEMYKDTHPELENSPVEIFIFDQKRYKDLLKKDIDTIFYISEDKKLKAKYRPKNRTINPQYLYSLMEPARPYTMQQVEKIYHEDYLNTNLYNCLFSSNDKHIQYKFLSLDELNLRPTVAVKNWDTYFYDPFLKDSAEDKMKLGLDILENGTYFPIWVFQNQPEDKTYLVKEGNHRVYSLKLAQAYGYVPKDFKILSIILPHAEWAESFTSSIHYEKYLNNPIDIRYNIDPVWGTSSLNDPNFFEDIKKSLIEEEHIINEYTVESKIYTVYELYQSLHIYPLFLRDLFYNFSDIKPAKFLTDEKKFIEWKNKVKNNAI